MTQTATKRVNPFKSTNFTLQGVVAFILPALLAISSALGVPEDLTTQIVEFFVGAIASGIGFWGSLREIFKPGVKFRLNSNFITYLVIFASGIWGFLEAYQTQLSEAFVGLVEAIKSGNLGIIIPSIFPLINIVYKIIQDRRNEQPQA